MNQKTSKCDIKAKSQPHFTLLAQDNLTPVILNEWIALAQANGAPADKVKGAKEILAEIEEWRRLNPTKCHTPN
jgi:hypothetical protein